MRNRIAFLALAFLFITLQSISLANQVFVRDVIIEIDANTYRWSNKNNIPNKIQQGYTSPKTIISFLSITPSTNISEKLLNKLIEEDKERLKSMGYFTNVEFFLTNNSKNRPDSKNLNIKLEEGIKYQSYGKYSLQEENFLGKRKTWGLAIGINYFGIHTFGVGYLDEMVLETPAILGLEYFYKSSLGKLNPKGEYYSYDLSFISGYRIHPDLSVNLEVSRNMINIKELYFNTQEPIVETLKPISTTN